MHPLDRRAFLGATLGSLAGYATPSAPAAEPPLPIAPAPRVVANPRGLDTLFLTYSDDPTRTVTVQWIGSDTQADRTVHCLSPLGFMGRQVTAAVRPFPMTDWKVFRAELTDLTPGTEYVLKVGTEPQTFRFRTMPAKATDTFHFVSGGDCGVNSHAIANNILAAKQDPYFALIAGDLGYDNGRSPRTALAFIQNYARHMIDSKGRLIPLVAGIGNHEVNGGYNKARKDAPFFLALFDGLYRETTYATLDFGDYLSLVLLDTGHIAPIGGEQTAWLDTVLAERADRPHLFVANHVPAYPSYRNPVSLLPKAAGTGEGNRKYWCPLFEKHNVDIVLEHHDHTFKRTHPLKGGMQDRYGVLYLGDGSWGMLRAPQPPEKRPYLATVSRSYHITMHRLEGEQRFHVALEESGRVADVCATYGKRPRRRG